MKEITEHKDVLIFLAAIIVLSTIFVISIYGPTGLVVQPGKVIINEKVEDHNNNVINTTISISKDGNTIYNNTEEEHSLQVDKGEYDISIKPVENLPVKEVRVKKHVNKDIDQIVDIDEITESGTEYSKTFAVDPKIEKDFDLSITVNATGDELFRCDEWDFENRECTGEWVKMLDTIPGKVYTIDVDCGFQEKGGCSCNGIRSVTLESDYSFSSGTDYIVDAQVFKGSGTNPSQLIDEEAVNFNTLPQTDIDDNPGSSRGNLVINRIDSNKIQVTFHNTSNEKLLGDNTFKIKIKECEEYDDDECEDYDTTTLGPETIHLSCSEPIDIGDNFDDFEVADIDKILSGSDCSLGNIDLLSPSDGYISSSNSINFEYEVYDENQNIDYCELIINGAVYQTDYSITESISQSFSQTLPDGDYIWSINCTTSNGYEIGSEERDLRIGISGCDPAYFGSTPTSAYLHYGSDVTSEVSASDNDYAYQYVSSSTRYIYLNWDNDISDIDYITKVNLSLEHRENNIDMSVQWWDGDSWTTVCDPPSRSSDKVDYCDLTAYIDDSEKANNISLRLKLERHCCSGYEKLDWAFINISYCKESENHIRGEITDSDYNPVSSSVNVYDSDGELVLSDNEVYDFDLPDGIYDIQINPVSGSINEIYIYNLTVNENIVNFTRLEDSLENITRPEFFSNWVEVISWEINPLAVYDTVRINMSYGYGTDLGLWKCTLFNFDGQTCTNEENWTYIQDVPDGPNTIVFYFNFSDPAVAIHKADKPPKTFLHYPPANFIVNASGSYNITFNCSAEDKQGKNKGIKNISLFITDNDNASFSLNETIIYTGSNKEETALFNKTLAIGNYTWNCLAYDKGGNYDWANNNRSIKVLSNDTCSPVVNLINPPNASTYNTSYIVFEYNVTDDSPIDYCELIINSTLITTDYNITRNTTQNFTYTLGEGDYNWSVNCTDIYGNEGAGKTWFFSIDIPSGTPNVSLVSPPNDYVTYNTNLSFTFYVVDDDPFLNCSLYLDNQLNQTLLNVQNNTNNTFNVSGIDIGYHDWKVLCVDEDNNSGWSQTWYLAVRSNETLFCCCGLSVSTTPEVVGQGEKVLVTADVSNLLTGLAAFSSEILSINTTIYRIDNGTEIIVVNNTPMAFLNDGLWYYEFFTGNNSHGTYIASVTMITNQTTPFVKEASDSFTIGEKISGLTITGISPDLVNLNQTVRLAAEIKYNGIAVDSSLISNVSLFIEMINGSNQTYTSSLNVEDGLIYIDGSFNETGVYYLDWTATYLSQTRTAREITVVVSWENLLQDINYTVNVELVNMIKETRQYLLQLLTDMEYMQQFTEEEIFLITDSVNSMSQIVNYLENGEITGDQAEQQFNSIKKELMDKLGLKMTGSYIGDLESISDTQSPISRLLNSLKDWRVVMFVMLLFMFAALMFILLTLVRILQTGVLSKNNQITNQPKKPEIKTNKPESKPVQPKKPEQKQGKRRYEIIIEKIKKKLAERKENKKKEQNSRKINLDRKFYK